MSKCVLVQRHTLSAEFRALMQTLGTPSDALTSSPNKLKLKENNFEKIIEQL
jgi:hypothetical protein